MDVIELKTLGGCEVRWRAAPLQRKLTNNAQSISIASKKARALLVYLALNAGQACLRDKLANLLWAEKSDAQARHSLRQALATLRKTLPQADQLFIIDGESIALRPDKICIDIEVLQRLAIDSATCIEELEAAASLYRGEFLEGLNPRAPIFEDWLMEQRSCLRESMQSILRKLLNHYEQRGASERAVQHALRLISLEPLNESVHRALMCIYQRLGRKNMALKQYRNCSNILRQELGIEPEAETKQLFQAILDSRKSRSDVTVSAYLWSPLAA